MQNFITLNKLGADIHIPFRYSNKAKHISIRINYKGPELILPQAKLIFNKSLTAGHKFLLQKELWIRKKLHHIPAHIPIDNKTIPIFGKIYFLEYIESPPYKIKIKEDVIVIHSSPFKYKDSLINFLKEILLKNISEIATILRDKHHLHFSNIKIINSKTKWGSCSVKAEISFNWRIIFAPKEILYYLVVHEMCHIMEMNHSKKFWNLVETILPEYKSAKSWLKTHGRVLHQYL